MRMHLKFIGYFRSMSLAEEAAWETLSLMVGDYQICSVHSFHFVNEMVTSLSDKIICHDLQKRLLIK